MEDTASKANRTLGFVQQNLRGCTSQVKSVSYNILNYKRNPSVTSQGNYGNQNKEKKIY